MCWQTLKASICGHNMFEEINAGFQQLVQSYKKSTLLREGESEKWDRETGTSKDKKRNEKHALPTRKALAAIAYMLSVSRRESLVCVPFFWTKMDFLWHRHHHQPSDKHDTVKMSSAWTLAKCRDVFVFF